MNIPASSPWLQHASCPYLHHASCVTHRTLTCIMPLAAVCAAVTSSGPSAAGSERNASAACMRRVTKWGRQARRTPVLRTWRYERARRHSIEPSCGFSALHADPRSCVTHGVAVSLWIAPQETNAVLLTEPGSHPYHALRALPDGDGELVLWLEVERAGGQGYWLCGGRSVAAGQGLQGIQETGTGNGAGCPKAGQWPRRPIGAGQRLPIAEQQLMQYEWPTRCC